MLKLLRLLWLLLLCMATMVVVVVNATFPIHTILQNGTMTLSSSRYYSASSTTKQLRQDQQHRDDDEAANNTNPNPNSLKSRKLQSRAVASTGTLKVLVLLTRWTDHPDTARPLIPKDDIELLFNAPANTFDDDILIMGSINHYFETSSYGSMNIEATVIDWITTDNTELFYSTNNGDRGSGTGIQDAFQTPLNTLNEQGFDFSTVDGDNDGDIDLTILLHSGYDGVRDDADCETGRLGEDRIRSHARSAALQSNFVSSQGGKILGPYVVAPAYRGFCNGQIARLGILAHEMLHPLGLPDLYDPNLFSVGQLGGIGNFDIMVSLYDDVKKS